MNNEKRIASFLFEVGTMRKLIRAHRQLLLTDDKIMPSGNSRNRFWQKMPICWTNCFCFGNMRGRGIGRRACGSRVRAKAKTLRTTWKD